MASKIVCVTGANRGIGFEIAKKLAACGFTIIMACRDVSSAKVAETRLKMTMEGVRVEHVYIDLFSAELARNAAFRIREMFPEGIDVLVNNAGFAYHWDSPEPFHKQAVDSIEINYYGTVALCEAMLPLIKNGGRLINVSSLSGSLSNILNKDLVIRWKGCKSNTDIQILLQEFVELTKSGEHISAGWPNSAYGVSKLALTKYTYILGYASPNVHVFSCCPGACRTEMSSFTGDKTAEEGADTPVWLATSQEVLQTIPQGGFVTDRLYRPQ